MDRIKKKISNNKSLIESFFSLSILNGLNVVLPLLTIPYILRVVGKANYGTYAYVYVLLQYFLLFNQFGSIFSVTKQITQNRNNHEKVNQIYSSVLVFRLLLFFIGGLFFFLMSPLILDTKEMKIMFILGLGIVFGNIFNPIWLFQGMEKMRYITYANFFSKTLFTVLIFVLIRQSSDYIYIILYNSLGAILSGIISSIIAIKIFNIKLLKVTWADIKYQYKQGVALLGSNIGITLYNNANIFILKFFVDEATLGVYAAAEKIIKGFQLLGNPISQALFPHFGHKYKDLSIKEGINQLKSISFKLSMLFIPMTIFIFIFAEFIVRIVAGVGYGEAVILVRIMSVVIFLSGLNYLLGIVGLINLNKQKSFFYLVLLSGIVSISFVLLTVPIWGNISAALSMVIAELVLFTGCVIVLYKLFNRN